MSDDASLPTSSDVPTAHLTSWCAAGEHWVAGTDGDGNCPACAGGTEAPSEPTEADIEETPALPEASEAADEEPAALPPPGATSEASADDEQRAEGMVDATPAAVTRARELGVNLATVTGTGGAGRVTKADVEAAAGGSA